MENNPNTQEMLSLVEELASLSAWETSKVEGLIHRAKALMGEIKSNFNEMGPKGP